jgi:DNA polymerase-1
LAALAVREAAAGKTVAIASSDKDFAQVVSDRIILWRPPAPGSNSAGWWPMDARAVEEKFGVAPAAMVDYLSLVGDAVDAIPGVPGVGAKTAAKWLRDHGSIEGIRRNLDALSPRLARNFRDSEAAILRNQRLIRFDLSLPLPEIPPSSGGAPEKLSDFLRTFELHSLLRRLPGHRGERGKNPPAMEREFCFH